MNTFKQLNTQKTYTISFHVFDEDHRCIAVLSNHKFGAADQSSPQRWTLYSAESHEVLSEPLELMTIDQALKFYEHFSIEVPMPTFRIAAKTAFGFTLYQGRSSRGLQVEPDAVAPMRFNEASRALESLAGERLITTLPGDWVKELHLVNTATSAVCRIMKPSGEKPALYVN